MFFVTSPLRIWRISKPSTTMMASDTLAAVTVSQRSLSASAPKSAGPGNLKGGRVPADLLNSASLSVLAVLGATRILAAVARSSEPRPRGPRTVYVVSASSDSEAPAEYAHMGGPRVIGVYRTMQRAKMAL